MRMKLLTVAAVAGVACLGGPAVAQEVRVTLTGVEARGGQIRGERDDIAREHRSRRRIAARAEHGAQL